MNLTLGTLNEYKLYSDNLLMDEVGVTFMQTMMTKMTFTITETVFSSGEIITSLRKWIKLSCASIRSQDNSIAREILNESK